MRHRPNDGPYGAEKKDFKPFMKKRGLDKPGKHRKLAKSRGRRRY